MIEQTTKSDVLDAEHLLHSLTALKNGDFSIRMPGNQSGVAGEIGDTVNGVLTMLNSLDYELNRIALEVGIEGKYGGQAEIDGAEGAWCGLRDNLNVMSANLTTQIRAITSTVNALANGDTSQKLTVEAKGEMSNLCVAVDKLARRMRKNGA